MDEGGGRAVDCGDESKTADSLASCPPVLRLGQGVAVGSAAAGISGYLVAQPDEIGGRQRGEVVRWGALPERRGGWRGMSFTIAEAGGNDRGMSVLSPFRMLVA
jgi:hypothetical protein